MLADKLILKNFRGFEDAEINFNDRLHVFIGDNGAGKTSILSAIMKCLKEIVVLSSVDYRTLPYISINDADINLKHQYTQITLQVNDQNNLFGIVQTKGSVPSEQNNLASLNKKLVAFRNNLRTKIDLGQIHKLPIIKYYSTNRNSVLYNKPTTNFTYKVPQLETWTYCYHNNISYSTFLHWFFDYETKELRYQRDQQNFQAQLPTLAVVRKAIEKTFKKLNGKDIIIKSDQIQRTGNQQLTPTLLIQERAQPYSQDINTLSDGEKSILSLVADIAYNLAIANPKDAPVETILKGNGIVMIDEIDAHLHPTWQREILPLLLELFPNIQFFVTTHSPQTIASISSEYVFICENFQVSKLQFKSKGLDSNSILRYIFNSTDRPREYEILLKEFDRLLNEDTPIEKLEAIIQKIKVKEAEDSQQNTSILVEELELQLEAYKFDLEHETDN